MGYRRCEVTGEAIIKETRTYTIEYDSSLLGEAAQEVCKEKFVEMISEDIEDGGVDLDNIEVTLTDVR